MSGIEIFWTIIAGLALLAFVLGLVIRFLQNFKGTIWPAVTYFYPDLTYLEVLFVRIRPVYKDFLQQNFQYYRQLSEKDKRRFEKRVQYFIKKKKFRAMEGLEQVTEEMKALIAASAIQITFGYPGVYFAHFREIRIFPWEYYSPYTSQMHAGDVNVKGILSFSWEHFVHGYLDDTDARNLGLHEMAHAFYIENGVANDEVGFITRNERRKLYELYLAEKPRIEAGVSILRPYAALDYHEFFAVTVEYFFEQKHDLKQYNPDLYAIMASILNQK